MDAALAPREDRGDRCGREGDRRAELHLATDLGQMGNPSPADGLQLFVTDLMKAGLAKDQIMTMGREVTGKLLMG
jgi:hypothetical protein